MPMKSKSTQPVDNCSFCLTYFDLIFLPPPKAGDILRSKFRYIEEVKAMKTLIDIDEKVLQQVMEMTGAPTKKAL